MAGHEGLNVFTVGESAAVRAPPSSRSSPPSVQPFPTPERGGSISPGFPLIWALTCGLASAPQKATPPAWVGGDFSIHRYLVQAWLSLGHPGPGHANWDPGNTHLRVNTEGGPRPWGSHLDDPSRHGAGGGGPNRGFHGDLRR